MRVVVIGAGGFAREVEWLIHDIQRHSPGQRLEFVGHVVTDLGGLGPNDGRERLLGDYTWLHDNRGSFDGFALGIGTPSARLRVGAHLTSAFPNAEWPTLVHPSAHMDERSARLERGALVCANVVVTVNVVYEEFAMTNLACTIGHEARLGRGCVLNPGVNVSGGVVIGDGVLVGTGAQLLQYVKIGEGATIGAGAVVTKDVAPGVTTVGVPARPLARGPAS